MNIRHLLAGLVLVLVSACALTPEEADSRSRLLYSVAGGFEAAAETAVDETLADELHDIAGVARLLAGAVEAGALEDEALKIVAFIQEIQQFILLVAPDLEPDTRARLEATYAVLGALKAYYTHPSS